jgi:1-acyl-sn-glycerol-3-phosphate acyltransferase
MLNLSNIFQRISIDIKGRSKFDVLKAFFMWFSVIISTLVTTSVILVIFPIVYFFDKQRHSLHFIGILWAKFITFMNPWWTFEFIGRENLAKRGEPVIYVANHQSQADILALFILSTRFRWLAKASLFKIPVFGWSMTAIGYVPVVRGSKKSSEKCLRDSAHHLKHGTPMVFFPEGTRSKNGELGQFKNGAFRLSTSLGVKIVPITLNGCSKLLPKGSFVPKKAHVTIHIHEALSPEGKTTDVLSAMARDVIEKQLSILNNSPKDMECK